MKNYSYIGIAFIILVFGIIFIPRIVDKIKGEGVVEKDRLNIEGKERDKKLHYIKVGDKAKTIPEFLFTNQDNLQISNADFKGKVTVVEFFFTTCPTICPIMNRNMQILDKEYHQNENFAIASFSINPEYDTPKILKEYAEQYQVKSLNWHFLTGDKDEIYELANVGFNLYTKQMENAPGGFEHSGHFALIDKDGFIRSRSDAHGNPMIFYQGTELNEVELLKEDIKKLLEE